MGGNAWTLVMEVMLATSSPGQAVNGSPWETNSSSPPPPQAGGTTSDHLAGTIGGEVTSKGGIDCSSPNGTRRISSPVDRQGTRRITSPIEQIASPTRRRINSPR